MVKVEVLSKEKLLKLNGKYIFHGSHVLFDECKPHKAHCGTHAKENEQDAIYGSDDLNFSVLFAFEKSPKEKYSWSADYIDGDWFGVLYNGSYIDNDACGYLYLFEKSNFAPTIEGGSQYICKKAIKPLKIVKVFYKDFKERFINKEPNFANHVKK